MRLKPLLHPLRLPRPELSNIKQQVISRLNSFLGRVKVQAAESTLVLPPHRHEQSFRLSLVDLDVVKVLDQHLQPQIASDHVLVAEISFEQTKPCRVAHQD